jgi:hypothetical protein
MSSHKHKEHLEKIKEAVTNAQHLSQEEKTNTIKHIEEWLAEDKASGIIYEELVKITEGIEPILKELGLI